MRNLLCFVFLLALASTQTRGQELSSSAPSDIKSIPREHVKIYSSGPDLIPPVLLARENSPAPTEKCAKKIDGKVSLALIIDSAGHPRNVAFAHPDGTVLDEFALAVAESDRFQPGTFQGAPAAFERILEMRLPGCVQTTKDDNGKKVTNVKLRQWPEQKLVDAPEVTSEATLAPIYDPNLKHVVRLGAGVSPPHAIFQPEAKFSDRARKEKIQGICVLSLVVDPHGMPRDVHVTRKLEPGLDANAILAVNSYRFKPAYRDGEPIPVMVFVEVRFRLY